MRTPSSEGDTAYNSYYTMFPQKEKEEAEASSLPKFKEWLKEMGFVDSWTLGDLRAYFPSIFSGVAGESDGGGASKSVGAGGTPPHFIFQGVLP